MTNLLKRGYTLIELLIVIAIIGILTAVLTTNLQAVRARARDARRKQDLNLVQQALRLYYNDAQSFPTTAQLTPRWGNSLTNAGGTITYAPLLPLDPSDTSTTNITYTYVSNGTTYTLSATLENASDPDLTAAQARCGGTGTSYTVCEE